MKVFVVYLYVWLGFVKSIERLETFATNYITNLFLFFRFKRRKRRFVVYFKDIKEQNYFLITQKKNTLKSNIVAAIGHKLWKNNIKWSSQKRTIKSVVKNQHVFQKVTTCVVYYIYIIKKLSHKVRRQQNYALPFFVLSSCLMY